MRPDFATLFPLRASRVHEVCGPAATGFAAVCAARAQGAVLWVRMGWQAEALNPVGLSAFFDPARLLVADVKDQTDALAVSEEALRDGSVALVITEITQDISLTQGRRLQLSAKAGKSTGLCLIPEGMGSNATETRWRCKPLYDPFSPPSDSTLQDWEIIKNKSGTLGSWHVRWDAEAHRLLMVSETGQ